MYVHVGAGAVTSLRSACMRHDVSTETACLACVWMHTVMVGFKELLCICRHAPHYFVLHFNGFKCHAAWFIAGYAYSPVFRRSCGRVGGMQCLQDAEGVGFELHACSALRHETFDLRLSTYMCSAFMPEP
jgi:hypothetical protein